MRAGGDVKYEPDAANTCSLITRSSGLLEDIRGWAQGTGANFVFFSWR